MRDAAARQVVHQVHEHEARLDDTAHGRRAALDHMAQGLGIEPLHDKRGRDARTARVAGLDKRSVRIGERRAAAQSVCGEQLLVLTPQAVARPQPHGDLPRVLLVLGALRPRPHLDRTARGKAAHLVHAMRVPHGT